MDKTLTLEPICITDGSSFGKILKSSDKKDYRTINGGTSINVGLVGFEYNSVHERSTACSFKKLHVDFSQSGGDLGWTNWELTPYEVSNFEIKDGTRLTSHTDRIICLTKKTGSHDLDKWYPQSYDFDNGNAPLDLFGSNMLALGLVASNDAYVSQKLWMKELQLTLTYTARYYAQFYNEGAHVETQTVNGGESATPPSVSKTGYRLVGWKRGNTTYAANNLPTSEYTDMRFDAVWERIYYKVTLPKTSTGSCRVTTASGGSTYTKTEESATSEYVTVAHGDSIKVYASGFGTRSQNLLVKINNGAETEKNGVGVNNIEIFSGTVTAAMTFAIRAKAVTFPVTVTKTAGGSVNVPASVTRYAKANLTVYADIGYYIQSITIDGTPVSIQSGATYYERNFTEDENASGGHTINVVFEIQKISVSFQLVGAEITVTDENNVDVTSGTSVDYGSDHVYTLRVASSASLNQVIAPDGETILDAFKQVQEFSVPLNNITEPANITASAVSSLATVTITQTEHGTITGDTGLFIIGKGSLTFTAEPDTYCNLVKWFNDATEYSITLPVDSNLNVSAQFERPEFSITCYPNSDEEAELGSVGKEDNSWPVYYSRQAGQNLYIEFFPKEYGKFYNLLEVLSSNQQTPGEWTELKDTQIVGDNRFVDAAGTIVEFHNRIDAGWLWVDIENIHSDIQLRFHLVEQLVYISADTQPYARGKVSIEPYPITGYSVAGGGYRGTTVGIKVFPNPGWHLAYWSFNTKSTANPAEYLVPDHESFVSAILEKDVFSIEVESIKNEKLETKQTHTVEYGSDYLLEITADFGYKIKDVFLDGVSIYDDVILTRRGGRYLLKDVTDHHSFRVIFTPKTYTNGRKLFDYWPPVIQSIRDMQEIARVQQPFIDEAWDAASWLIESQFIDTASEEAVIQWEKELDIVPNQSDTLTQRKARLKIKWVPHNRFTMQWLYEWLCTATGRSDIKYPVVPENTYGLIVHLPSDTDWNTLFDDIKKYKPCNIYLDPHVDIPDGRLNVLSGFAIVSNQYYEYKNVGSEEI